MKRLIFIAILASLATTASAEYRIRSKMSSDIARPGSLINPYVIVDDQGNETELRPKFPVSLDPGNPDYDPGGRYNPLEVEDRYGN